MSANGIHPTAVVAPGAELGPGCRIDPYCVIGEHVRLGAGCHLHSHVVLDGHLSLGEACEVYSFACLGKQTQDLKYTGEVTRVEIGARNVIREYVTVNAATGPEQPTCIGDDCLIQSYCHIAHECVLGSGVIMSSGSMLAGHVLVGDGAVIGGCAGVVQFVRIGTMAFVGAYSKLTHDVLPYCIADGVPAALRAINRIGMERHGKDRDAIRAVTQAFKTLVLSGMATEAATAELAAAAATSSEVREMLDAVAASQRGLARPRCR